MSFSGWTDKVVNFFRRFNRSLSPEKKEKIDVLNKIKLFEFCRGRDLLEIAAECEFCPIEAGDKIIEKGSEGDGIYMIDSGELDVILDDGEAPVASFGPGDYVGEMSLLDNEPRSADIICREPGRLLFFSKKGFLKLIQKKSEASFRFLIVQARTLSQRLRDTNRQLSEK